MKEKIIELLSEYVEPHLQQDLVSAKLVKKASCDAESNLDIALEFPFPMLKHQDEWVKALTAFIDSRMHFNALNIQLTLNILPHRIGSGLAALPGVKNIIAVASGKGGVGKSTTAVNLALALQQEGAKVGILDADIYGPSLPLMLGIEEEAVSPNEKHLEPIVKYGLQCMSLGFLINNDETPMVWRGPMATSALKQLFGQTLWQDLDYLVIDLPPGTGDIQLTMAQSIPVTAALIVSTPQDLALLDARKAKRMFDKVKIPVLGIIENMAMYTCPHCGQSDDIFGHGGGAEMASAYQLPLLGKLPLERQIRFDVDNGTPTVLQAPDSPVAASYRQIGRSLTAKLSTFGKDYTSKFPKIVVENGQ